MKIAALPHGTEPDATRRLHAEAQKCKRLASEVVDVVVRDALIELASELEQETNSQYLEIMLDCSEFNHAFLSPLPACLKIQHRLSTLKVLPMHSYNSRVRLFVHKAK